MGELPRGVSIGLQSTRIRPHSITCGICDGRVGGVSVYRGGPWHIL